MDIDILGVKGAPILIYGGLAVELILNSYNCYARWLSSVIWVGYAMNWYYLELIYYGFEF